MFNLMQEGLDAQKATVDANQRAAEKYYRIVGQDECVQAVQLEAVSKQCFVWTNNRQSVICRNKPRGDYHKMHVVIKDQQPLDAA